MAVVIAACSFVPVPRAEAYFFSRNLAVGSAGADVAALQTWLMANGYAIPSISAGVSKGYFGPQTRAAVAAYQRSVGLPALGFFGPLTRNRVNSSGAVGPVPVPSDTVPPIVSLTAPEAFANVSGWVTVTAYATDDREVAGVQFKLDGANLGVEDTTAPYAVSWDTVGGSSGTHALAAVVRDRAGNTATASSRIVTVSNASLPPPPPGLPSCSISYTPATVVSGSSLSGTWSSNNSSSRSYIITNSAGAKIFGPSTIAAQGSFSIPSFTDLPPGSYTRTDTVTGPGGTATCSAGLTVAAAPDVPPKRIEVTKIASGAPPHTLFESHNQLVVANRRGIFLTFSDSFTDPAKFCYHWKLLRSTDSGRSFTELYDDSGCGTAPTVETDEDDNIYLFSPRRESNGKPVLVWMKFLASDNYANPKIVRILNGPADGKFTAIYDRTRQQFYFEGYGTTDFMVIDKEGVVVRNYLVRKGGPLATTQYPHMRMDGSRLYVAWNSVRYDAGRGVERGGSFVTYSDDAGVTWFTPGSPQPLTLPIISDETGPATAIQLPPYANDTYSWLANFMPREGKLHFMFQGRQGKDQIYERFDLEPFANDIFRVNAFHATHFSVHSWDGNFTKSDAPGSPLYVIAGDTTKSNALNYKPLVVMKSEDNGVTWIDHAYTPEKYPIGSINGPRTFRSAEGIIGTFSTQEAGATTRSVYFFRVPPEGPEPTPARGNLFRGPWHTGTFESTTDGFLSYAPGAVSRDTSTAREGSASLRVRTGSARNAGGNAGGANVIDLPSLRIGQTYTFSFWAKTDTGTMPIIWSMQSGTGDVNCLSGNAQLTISWQKFTKTCVLDANKPVLYMYSSAVNSTFWIDDIHIKEGS